MDIQVIVSTISNEIFKLDKKTRDYHNIKVINQKPNKLNNWIDKNIYNNIEWIEVDQKGLSKSRNLALKIANEDYVYLADDDIVLSQNFRDTILNSFQKNPDFDILAFNIEGIEKEFKKKINTEKKLNSINSLKLSSAQVVYKLDFIKKNRLQFDERFGTGAIYKMGEENIFIQDALKAGARIKFIPKTIAKIHLEESSWFAGYNKKYFFDRGAIFKRMYGPLAPFYSMAFCINKRRLYKNNFGILSAFLYTVKGMNSLN